MKYTKLLPLLILLLPWIIGACSNNHDAETPPPEMDLVTLQIASELSHWLPSVASCAAEIPDFAIYTEVLPQSDFDLDKAELVMRVGARSDTDPSVAIMGVETLVVVAGSQLPLTSLSKDSLQAIFTGSITHWDAVKEMNETGNALSEPIQTLSYPESHPLRDLFEDSYLEREAISSNPQIFSTLDYLDRFLLDNPYAIGYVLKSQIPEHAKIVTISGFDPKAADHYVLAITPQAPAGKLKQFLLCLQNSR